MDHNRKITKTDGRSITVGEERGKWIRINIKLTEAHETEELGGGVSRNKEMNRRKCNGSNKKNRTKT